MPANDRPPSFPMFPNDLLGERFVRALEALPPPPGHPNRDSAFAGYMRLLLTAWDQPEQGVFPDDDELLAEASGLAAAWPDYRRLIARLFEVRDGKWIQKRMVRERQLQVERHEKASEAGRKGAAKTNSLYRESQPPRGVAAARPQQESVKAATGKGRPQSVAFESKTESKEESINRRSVHAPAPVPEVERQIRDAEAEGLIQRNATSGEWEACEPPTQDDHAEPSRAPSHQTGPPEPPTPPTDDFSLSRSGQVNGMVPIAEAVSDAIAEIGLRHQFTERGLAQFSPAEPEEPEPPPTQEQIAEELRRARKP